MIGWLAKVAGCLRDSFTAPSRRPDKSVAHQKREVLDHAADAATRVKNRMENPRIRLIVQSVDGIHDAFKDKRGP